jgi:hypothetical protein
MGLRQPDGTLRPEFDMAPPPIEIPDARKGATR